MPNIIEITDFHAPELDPYARLTQNQLRNRLEPEKGIFIAESPKVIDRALDAGYKPVSLLMERKQITGPAAGILSRCGDAPVYTADREMLAELTGFELTRGVLCAFHRPAPRPVEELCKNARRVAVLEGIVDSTNVGAIFRSAAALNMDAVLINPSCCDPLCRRAVRVSMGTVFQVPWGQLGETPADWPEKGMDILHSLGFKTAAMALSDRKKLADLLASSGRPADALEPHFTCRLCEDTGIVDGRTCSCVHKVMQQLRRSEIEALSSLSISSFDTMELRYYPARMDASLGEPIRSYMSTLLDDLRGYADEFDTTSESLMLLGNAGLGKTHAALAIAGKVLEKGFDVIYVSSPDFFSKLEALHFGSDPAGEEEMLLRTAAGADLLILDDLGSEFNSSFLISTLYSLLNNRLGAKLPTIVTTNITDGALLEKLYTEKISSRLSSFVPFLFMGDDIRAQKAEEA